MGDEQKPRRVIGFVNWTLTRDSERTPDQIIYRCDSLTTEGTLCDATGPVVHDVDLARDWVLIHMREEPTHLLYSQMSKIACHMVPQEGVIDPVPVPYRSAASKFPALGTPPVAGGGGTTPSHTREAVEQHS